MGVLRPSLAPFVAVEMGLIILGDFVPDMIARNLSGLYILFSIPNCCQRFNLSNQV